MPVNTCLRKYDPKICFNELPTRQCLTVTVCSTLTYVGGPTYDPYAR